MTTAAILTVRRAALHFSGDIYERYFSGLGSLILLRDGSDLVVMPVRHQAGGGYVIKLRNASGDRTVDAADFFRDNGIDDAVEMTLPSVWSDDRAALVAKNTFD